MQILCNTKAALLLLWFVSVDASSPGRIGRRRVLSEVHACMPARRSPSFDDTTGGHLRRCSYTLSLNTFIYRRQSVVVMDGSKKVSNEVVSLAEIEEAGMGRCDCDDAR
jgi:hypothetical protein